MAHDRSGMQREICSQQPYPFTVSNLTDFCARLDHLYFVFNINDALLKENQFYHQPVALPQQVQPQKQSVLLSPHLLTILETLRFKENLDQHFPTTEYTSNFEAVKTAFEVAGPALNCEDFSPSALI